MKDKTHDQGLDMLSMYDPDVFYLSMLAVKEALVVLGFVYALKTLYISGAWSFSR